MKNINESAPKARFNGIVVQELRDELLLYCLDTNKAFCLNAPAAAVYQSADGGKSIAEIALDLTKKFSLPVTEDFVVFTLGELKNANLLERPADLKNRSALARREMIRRAALSTVVALPVISTLVAPPAAAAQSSGGAACRNDGETCTGARCTRGNCCAGLVCVNGTCDLAQAIGEPCASSAQCCSNNCVGGVCLA